MALSHLTELVARFLGSDYKGKVAARERATRVDKGTLGYYLKPSTKPPKSPPNAHKVVEIAAVIGCEPIEVLRAFEADTGHPPPVLRLTDQEMDLVFRIWRLLSARGQRLWFGMGTDILRHEAEEADRPK